MIAGTPQQPVFCKDCDKLKRDPKPFCVWIGAYLEPSLLDQPVQDCDGYKKLRGKRKVKKCE